MRGTELFFGLFIHVWTFFLFQTLLFRLLWSCFLHRLRCRLAAPSHQKRNLLFVTFSKVTFCLISVYYSEILITSTWFLCVTVQIRHTPDNFCVLIPFLFFFDSLPIDSTWFLCTTLYNSFTPDRFCMVSFTTTHILPSPVHI